MSKVSPRAGRHHRALDVPPGTARSPGRRPRDLARLGALPEGEVAGVALALVDLDPFAGPEIVEPLAGQIAVPGERFDRVVDVSAVPFGRPAGGWVRMTLLDQRRGHRDDPRDVIADLRRVRRRHHAECEQVLFEDVDEVAAEGKRVLALLVRAADDLVVDVRVVAHVVDRVAELHEPPVDHVERSHRPGVPDVAVVVDGHAADVHPGAAGLDRFEVLELAAQRVVDAEHAVTSGRSRRSPIRPWPRRCPWRRRSPARAGSAPDRTSSSRRRRGSCRP